MIYINLLYVFFHSIMAELAVVVSIGIIKAGVFVYDLVTYPIYALIQQPWKKQKLMETQRVSFFYNFCT